MALIRPIPTSGGKPPIAIGFTTGNILAVNAASGGHSKYDNTSPYTITIDNITITYNNHAFTADVAGTYFYATQAVYNGEITTLSEHAAANSTATLIDSISPVIFIPD